MKLYRFSPITSEDQLHQAIRYLHKACHQLCYDTFGRYLPVSGNVGIFAHYPDEFDYLMSVRQQLTDNATHYKDKYFLLHEPIVINEKDGVPGATYKLLYIRRVDPYRSQVGDIDFVLPSEQHQEYKQALNGDTFVNGARLFGRTEENMIELWNPDIDAAAYVLDRPLIDKIIGPA